MTRFVYETSVLKHNVVIFRTATGSYVNGMVSSKNNYKGVKFNSINAAKSFQVNSEYITVNK